MVSIAVADHSIATAINAALSYYAIFSYPLRADEVHQYCGYPCARATVTAYLEEQASLAQVNAHKGYYSVQPGIEKLVERRLTGNGRAETELRNALKVARFIYQSPFVRFVGISGSLSKGYADARSDFDFFIVTSKNRLWICRTILHLFKKVTFLAGQQRKFCMNYFVDESALTLAEQNIYTATELASMIPACNRGQHQALLKANEWMNHFLPNYKRQAIENTCTAGAASWWKKSVEFLVNAVWPEQVNRSLMKLTDARWKKKWAKKKFPESDYPLAFKTTLHISKNHPANYQKKILEQLQKQTKA